MKLRNKKTGEIKEIIEILVDDKSAIRTVRDINSLAELNEEWEDYEEPKEHWVINTFGDVETVSKEYTDDIIDELREIGNYFETKAEAEKAVEKFKAWQRLKDKGFRFTGITRTSLDMDCIQFEISNDFYNEQSLINSKLNKDLVLLFSGGEE